MVLLVTNPLLSLKQMKGLDFTESLSDSKYKESFRSDMITWSEGVRKSDPNVFLRTAIQECCSKDFSVWVLVDARRPCDLELFKEEYSHAKTITVRIVSSKETREKRGWTFQSGVDDVESECALDDVEEWDLVVRNQQDTSDEQLEQQLQPVIQAALDVLRDG